MKEKALSFINQQKLTTIINLQNNELAERCALLAIEGGIKVIEFSSGLNEFEKIVSRYASNKAIITGVSQVITAENVKKASASGAAYVSSSYFNENVIKTAQEEKMPIIISAVTPSEIIQAYRLGAGMIDIFPVDAVGGARYLRIILAEFPFLNLRARGGLNIYNFVDMLDAGASAVGLSSGIFDKKSINRKDYEMLRKKINLFMDRYRLWESMQSQDNGEINNIE